MNILLESSRHLSLPKFRMQGVVWAKPRRILPAMTTSSALRLCHLHTRHHLRLYSTLLQRGESLYLCRTRKPPVSVRRLPDAATTKNRKTIFISPFSSEEDAQKQYTYQLKKNERSTSRLQTILGEMSREGIPKNEYHYAIALSAYAKDRTPDVKPALALWEEMIVSGIQPNEYMVPAGIRIYCKAKQYEKALELFDRMQNDWNVQPNVHSYTPAIQACAKLGKLAQALDLLERMKAQGIKPNIHCYSILITACRQQPGQCTKALELLKEMEQEQHLQPTGYNYDDAIRACGKEGRVEEALDLLDRIQKEGFNPSVFTYAAALDACAKSGRVQEALKVWGDMKEKGGVRPNEYCYSAVISACGKGGDSAKALALLDEMEQEGGIQPNDFVFSAAMSACAKAGRVQNALDLWGEMKKRGFKPHHISYNALITACGNSREWERVFKILNEMRQQGVRTDVVTYASAMSACVKAGRLEETLELWKMMKQEAIPPNVVAYSMLITAHGSRGEWKNALEVFEEMKEMGVAPNQMTYNSLITACGNGGRFDKAMEMLTEMEQMGIRPDVVTCNAMMAACAKMGEAEKAIDLLTGMSESGLLPDEISYSTALIACFDVGRYKDAIQLVELGFGSRTTPSIENGANTWDLRGFGLGCASMIVSFVLLNTDSYKTNDVSDFVFITGEGQVLQTGVPQFLTNHFGPVTTIVDENEGRFLISNESIQFWRVSDAFPRFKETFSKS
eukprot:scaffold2997_cov182-Amphora_coffeaeformis.AAC.2